MAKKPRFCKNCVHYLAAEGHGYTMTIPPTPRRMYAECAATKHEQTDFVSGKTTLVRDHCSKHNGDGLCPLFERRKT